MNMVEALKQQNAKLALALKAGGAGGLHTLAASAAATRQRDVDRIRQRKDQQQMEAADVDSKQLTQLHFRKFSYYHHTD